MKRLLTAVLIACVAGTGAFAQGASPLPSSPLGYPQAIGGADPQFAVSLLTEYFEKDEREARVGGVVLTSIGVTMLAGGLGLLGYSFTPPGSTGMYSDADGQLFVRGFSIGAAGVGTLLGGIGIGLLAKPDDAYKNKYAYLYAETDPVVQEAIAFGVMKDIADQARRDRIVSGLINVSLPLATMGGHAIASMASGSWDDFDENVLGSLGWTLPSLVSGVIMLVTGKSDEERLLDSYRSMSASYASRVGGKD
jgi:hypothetical protein